MEMNDVQYKLLREMSPQRKLETAMNLYYSAKELKVSMQTNISIEKGKYTPSLTLALKIGRHLQMFS